MLTRETISTVCENSRITFWDKELLCLNIPVAFWDAKKLYSPPVLHS